jgi:mono/diheme cytochrome c family protein
MTRLAGWTLVLALWVIALIARDASAQDTQENAARSTRSGVYTNEQADRGRETYAGACQGCHTIASHSGTVFRSGWGGRLLSDLLSFLKERMPKNEPGSLTPGEYADVTAYLLRMNGMPAGSVELPDDVSALRKIRIDTTKGP